jgi:hypothetical protein
MGFRLVAAALFSLSMGCGGGGGDGADAAPTPDQAPAPDVSPVDCEADHAESAEPSNNLFEPGHQPELTGLSVAAGGEPFTVCGEINPSQASGGNIVDADFFEFTVSGSSAVDIRVELRAPDGGSVGVLFVDLWTAGGNYLGGSRYLNTHAVFAGETLAPGNYLVSVTAIQPAPPLPFLYEVTVLQNPHTCETPTDEPDYLEANDGETHRDNDVVAVSYSPQTTIIQTSAADSPELTGHTLEAGTTYHIRGNSADVETDGDEYLDRDTFQLSTAPDVNELEIRLTWPHEGSDVDMDIYLFEQFNVANDYTFGAGTVIGTTADEHLTLNVDPDATYWLWVATYDDEPTMVPLTYDVTVCARTFPP